MYEGICKILLGLHVQQSSYLLDNSHWNFIMALSQGYCPTLPEQEEQVDSNQVQQSTVQVCRQIHSNKANQNHVSPVSQVSNQKETRFGVSCSIGQAENRAQILS